MVYNCTLFNLLFGYAPLCPACSQVTDKPRHFCPACRNSLATISNPCKKCGLPIPQGSHCGRCLTHPPPFEALISACVYQFPLSPIIQQFKFSARLYFAYPLSQLLADRLLQDSGRTWPECIIPVPLHNARQRQRGFNQAVELARPVAKRLNIALDHGSCTRHKHTRQQASLKRSQRQANLHKAFSLRRAISYRHVAIIDDVVTTANTVAAMAEMLRSHGVETVEIWCIARAL